MGLRRDSGVGAQPLTAIVNDLLSGQDDWIRWSYARAQVLLILADLVADGSIPPPTRDGAGQPMWQLDKATRGEALRRWQNPDS